MKYFFLLLFGITPLLANSQVFNTAPKSSKGKVHTITEWLRPNLKVKAKKNAISTFDAKGNLIQHQLTPFSPAHSTEYNYDAKNRLLAKLEGKIEELGRQTHYSYAPNATTEEVSFRGKMYRTIYYYNLKKQVVEKKVYSKGLELGKKYLLKERILYHYNKKDSLSAEKIYEYDLLGQKDYDTRKCIYHYHPNKGYLIKKVYYDIDGSANLVIDFTYDIKRRIRTQLSHYLIDDKIQIVEYLYKDNNLWQKLTYENQFKHIEIYTEGRLIRLRSYLNDKIYRVVDYEWGYF